jgi:Zn-finger domain-containing protein
MGSVTYGRFGPGQGSSLDSSNTPTGGDGGDGGMLEPRVAKLESHAAHILRDTSDIKQKLERVADDVSSLKVSMATLTGRQDVFEIKLDAMDKKFEAKFDGLDKKFATKADLYEALGNQQKWMFRTMLTIMGAGIGLTGAVVTLLIKFLPNVP